MRGHLRIAWLIAALTTPSVAIAQTSAGEPQAAPEGQEEAKGDAVDEAVHEALERVPSGDTDVEEALKVRAREAYRLGLALSSQGQLSDALGEFSRSFELLPHPRTRYNVAYCELGLKRLTRARAHFREAVASPRLDPVLVSQAKAYLAKIGTQLGALSITGSKDTRVTIDGRPISREGGSFVAGLAPIGDGVALGQRRVTVVIDPGSHVVAWEHGEAQRTETVVITSGDQERLALTFPAPPALSRPSPPLPTGPSPAPALREDPSPEISPYVVVGLSLTGAFLVSGAVAGGAALGWAGAVQDQCTQGYCAPSAREDIDAANAWALGADITFGLAGAFAAFTLVAWLVDGDEDTTHGLRFGPHGIHARF